jgi:hypothetical protein
MPLSAVWMGMVRPFFSFFCLLNLEQAGRAPAGFAQIVEIVRSVRAGANSISSVKI